MKYLTLVAALMMSTSAYAGQHTATAPLARVQLTDAQMDKVVAGDSGFSFSGPFMVTSLMQTATSITLMGNCSGSCTVSVMASSP
jgi:hypothetical protein